MLSAKRNSSVAIQQLKDSLPAERVGCPVDRCPCSYDLYNYAHGDVEGNRALLVDKLRREHPDHPNEIITLHYRPAKVSGDRIRLIDSER